MRSIWMTLFVGCVAFTGCGGGSSLPAETDVSKGREAMKTAMENWKQGGTVEELKKATSILARDPDWKAGLKLTKYEIGKENDRSGVDLVLSVKLTMAKAEGQTVEKKVKYTVGIGSSTVVFRNE